MDRMVMQASQKSLMLLAECGSLQATPFARLGPAAAAAEGSVCCVGTYLQQLSSYQQLLSTTQSLPPNLQQYHPPLQQLPPRRSHGPYLPPLRTLRSRTGSSRLYSVQSAGGVQQIEEPIIVAASWLGAKRSPFAK